MSKVEADVAHKDNHRVNEVLIDILKSWYESHVEDPCWEYIVKALKCVGENHLANDVYKICCLDYFFTSYFVCDLFCYRTHDNNFLFFFIL